MYTSFSDMIAPIEDVEHIARKSTRKLKMYARVYGTHLLAPIRTHQCIHLHPGKVQSKIRGEGRKEAPNQTDHDHLC